MDGFANLFRDELVDAGVSIDSVHQGSRANVTLPGFFRPTKQWDLVVIKGDHLLGAIELKALCGPSFGNNYNNRVEEAIGSAADLWTAYREGLFLTSPKPFLGFVLILEDASGSQNPVTVSERHFSVDDVFRDASYAGRCEQSLRRLVLERQYDAALFLTSERPQGKQVKYLEPASDLTAHRFVSLMCSQIVGAAKAIS